MKTARRFPFLFAPLTASMLLSSCGDMPSMLQGDFDDTSIAQAQQTAANGAMVRWGGDIVSVTPEADQTCLEILGRPLDFNARPNPEGQPLGRFVACHADYYDPDEYSAGREVTVAGKLQGIAKRKIGDYHYQFPKVAASGVYLWSEEDLQRAHGFMDASHDADDPFGNQYNGNGLFYGSQLDPKHGYHDFKELTGKNDKKSEKDDDG